MAACSARATCLVWPAVFLHKQAATKSKQAAGAGCQCGQTGCSGRQPAAPAGLSLSPALLSRRSAATKPLTRAAHTRRSSPCSLSRALAVLFVTGATLKNPASAPINSGVPAAAPDELDVAGAEWAADADAAPPARSRRRSTSAGTGAADGCIPPQVRRQRRLAAPAVQMMTRLAASRLLAVTHCRHRATSAPYSSFPVGGALPLMTMDMSAC